MQAGPIVSQPITHVPPDPIAAILYVAVFVGMALLAMRRPAYAICALIVVQPFAFYRDVLETTITLPKVVLLGTLVGIAAYRDAFAPIVQPVPWRIFIAGTLVVAATTLSYAQALHHEAVLRESLKALEYLVLFVTVTAAYRLDPDRRPVRTALLATAIAVALLALAQEVVGAPSALLANGHTVPRVAGPLEGPNQLAGYFDVALPLAFALAVTEGGTLAFAALFVMVCADLLTFSRGGAIGALAGLLAVGFTLRRNLGRSIVAICAGLAAGAGVAFAWSLILHSPIWQMTRLFVTESSYAGGVGTRSELWNAAIELWKRHPVFGIGAGNFELEIPLTGLQGVRTHSNSLYLQSLVEGGIPLLAATLWLVYTSIAAFARDRLGSPLVTAAFAASIGLALHQIIDFLTFYPKVGGEWWIVLALGAAEVAAIARTRPLCATPAA